MPPSTSTAPVPRLTSVAAGRRPTKLHRLHRSPAIEGLPPLHGGLVGYLGYDVVREVERLPDVPTDDQEIGRAHV